MYTRCVAAAAAAVLVGGCGADRPAPSELEMSAPVFVVGERSNLGTHMTGAEEVFVPAVPGGPTPAESQAQGQALFRVQSDGSVSFRLIAANIENVIMAHIHCGRFGENGPIRMWLYPVIGPTGAPAPSGGGPQNGVLATGSFSPDGLVCPAANVGVDTPLLDAMRAGLTYVNVHTNDGVGRSGHRPGRFSRRRGPGPARSSGRRVAPASPTRSRAE
jgi:hypothetical protein